MTPISLLYAIYYFISLSLAEARIATPNTEDGESKIIIGREDLTRKRNHIQSTTAKLDPQIYDEFGNNFVYEDNVAWSRILGQTSFSHEQCDVEVDSDVICHLVNDPSISCKTYMESIGYDVSKQCEVQVVFEYVVRNIGTVTDKITKLKTAINSERPFSYITDSVQWSERTLTPGHHLVATQRRSLNFCTSYSEDLSFEVGVECDENDAKRMFYPKIALRNNRNASSCNAKLDLSCQSIDGGPCTLIQHNRNSLRVDPQQYNFTYTISNKGRQSIVLSRIVFSTENSEKTTMFPTGEHDKNNLASHHSLSRSNMIFLNESSSSCAEMNAKLQYATLPSHNSIVCYAQAQYAMGSFFMKKGKGKGINKYMSPSRCTSGGKGKTRSWYPSKGKGDKGGKGKAKKKSKGGKDNGSKGTQLKGGKGKAKKKSKGGKANGSKGTQLKGGKGKAKKEIKGGNANGSKGTQLKGGKGKAKKQSKGGNVNSRKGKGGTRGGKGKVKKQIKKGNSTSSKGKGDKGGIAKKGKRQKIK